MQSVHIPTAVVSSNPAQGEGEDYNIM